MDVLLTILDVFLPVSGCIYGSKFLYDCYWLKFIHFDKYTSRFLFAGCKNAMFPVEMKTCLCIGVLFNIGGGLRNHVS